MKHKLQISVSKEPQTGGIVTCRSVFIRDREGICARMEKVEV